MRNVKLNTVHDILFGTKFRIEDTDVKVSKASTNKSDEEKEKLKIVIEKQERDTKLKALGLDITDAERIKEFLFHHCEDESLIKFLFPEIEIIVTRDKNTEMIYDKREGNKSSTSSVHRDRIDPIDNNIIKQLMVLNNKCGYNIDIQTYKKFYLSCLYAARVIEDNETGTEVYERAYKMAVLFGSLRAFDKFVASYGSNIAKPVHDLLYREIPVKDDCHIEIWRMLIKTHGIKMINAVEKAADIEKYIIDNNEDKDYKVIFKSKQLSKEQLKDLFAKVQEAELSLKYKRAKEDQELADICNHYKVKEKTFNRAIDLMKDGTLKFKTKDNLPDVTVDCGKEIDESMQSYYMVKLPIGNKHGLILGDVVNCCQSIGGDSERCVIDGMNRENNGFYVLIKAKKGFDVNNINWKNFENNGHQIVGQAYVWISIAGNIVFDSWENLRPEIDDTKIPLILETFAKKATEKDESISRVMIGLGGRTPETFEAQQVKLVDRMLEGSQYGDSLDQALIYESQRLKDIKRRLQTYFTNPLDIISIEQKTTELLEFLSKIESAGNIVLQGLIKKIFYHRMIDVDFKQLANLSDEKINFLRNNDAILNAFEIHDIDYNDLKECNIDKFKVILSWQKKIGRNLYDTQKYSLSKYENLLRNTKDLSIKTLKNLSIGKIIALTSYNALELYYTEVSSQDLIHLEVNVIKALTSDRAIYAYKAKYITFDDLKKLDLNLIVLLTSNNCCKLYDMGVTFSDLKNHSMTEIKILTSDDSIKIHQDKIDINSEISEQEIIESILNIVRMLTSIDSSKHNHNLYTNTSDVTFKSNSVNSELVNNHSSFIYLSRNDQDRQR